MNKVYLLLRNNQQTGPYNLEELIKFDLKPIDLIWIEGKSAGWYYPQELKALHPYLPFVKQQAQTIVSPAHQNDAPKLVSSSPKKVFVSMPANAVKEEPATNPSLNTNKKIEVQNLSEQATLAIEAEEIKTTYAKSLQEVESDYTNWVYKQKTKKHSAVSRKGIVAACLIVTVAFASWWAVNSFSGSSEITPVEQQVQFTQTTEASGADTVIEEKSNETVVLTEKKASSKNTGINKNVQLVKVDATLSIQEKKPVVTEQTPVEKEDEVFIPEEEPRAISEERKQVPVIAEAPKEKKKLREKFLDLFKKKPEDKSGAEAKPTEEKDGQRSSAKREAGANLAQLVSIRFTIPNDWMMGIKGAKATLTNRSNETIVKAAIEVSYYNDDNETLDTKTVSFTNIEAKNSRTVSIPDHSTATRIEYKIVSVMGANEPFAGL